jgi:hypothetical protein
MKEIIFCPEDVIHQIFTDALATAIAGNETDLKAATTGSEPTITEYPYRP